jgi:His/Glu/Gln/Arg/opine family amino acid ABC transporter permease subunit
MYIFDWSVVSRNLHLLLPALQMTFRLAVLSEVLSLIVGLLVALARSSHSKALSAPASLYVDALRAVPLLVLLIWVYYGVSIVIGITFTAFQAGILSLGFFYGAYNAEIIRAGLQAVPRGQREAALTLGMSRWQASYVVVIPQAIRIVVPALANNFVGMMKDVTLVSVIGLSEFMQVARTVVSRTFRPFEIYTFVAGVYLLLTMIFSRFVAWSERMNPIH